MGPKEKLSFVITVYPNDNELYIDSNNSDEQNVLIDSIFGNRKSRIALFESKVTVSYSLEGLNSHFEGVHYAKWISMIKRGLFVQMKCNFIS